MKRLFFILTGYAGIALALFTAASGIVNGLTLLGIVAAAASFAAAEKTKTETNVRENKITGSPTPHYNK